MPRTPRPPRPRNPRVVLLEGLRAETGKLSEITRRWYNAQPTKTHPRDLPENNPAAWRWAAADCRAAAQRLTDLAAWCDTQATAAEARP